MDYFMPLTEKEFSEKKMRAYEAFGKVINEGRKNPIWFVEYMYGIKLIDYQAYGFMKSWWTPFVLWLCSRRAGKALALDTPIPTPSGFKKMEDIHVGDYVFGQNGKPTKVTFESETFYNHKCYKVKFDDGDTVVADADHLWEVTDVNRRSDFNMFAVKTTEELYNDMQRGIVKQRIKNNLAVEYPALKGEKNIPARLYEKGRDFLWVDNSLEVLRTARNGARKGGHRKEKDNPVIPEEIMFSSIRQRKAFVMGLFDSKGIHEGMGVVHLIAKSEAFIGQLSELLSSIGYKNLATGKKVTLKISRENSLFKLKSKREQLPYNLSKKMAYCGIDSITPCESVPCKCIQVDAEDHLYLFGRKYHVTHNTTTASVFLQTKMLLIPDYKVYISANSAAQSIEIFKMIEDIALQRVPSFASATDIFAYELEKNANNKTGFVHDMTGHRFRLPNNSQLVTLSTNVKAERGKGGSILFDETAWQTQEQMAALEHFADMDSSFKTEVGARKYFYPKAMPLQLFYASSAGDAEFPFYDKYRTFSKNMFMGDSNYFVFDLNVNTILNHSTIDGKPIKAHISQEAVDKAIEDDPEAADRELFNKFRKGGGRNTVVKPEVIFRNSETRVPIFRNEDGKRKYILCYDPARNYDGSILGIFELIEDKKIGFYLKLVNVIPMIDHQSKNKTPLNMKEQLKVLRKAMIDYNGDAEDWGNIELYIDAGAGGQAQGGIADQLFDDWEDEAGNVYKGVIDGTHPQYETARKSHPNAIKIVHLVNPQSHKKIIYDALEKLAPQDVIKFMLWDKKEYIMLPDGNNDFYRYTLSYEEMVALGNCEIMKTQAMYMCRYITAQGNVVYELDRNCKTIKHDDHAYVLALAAYALAVKRRAILTSKKKTTQQTTVPTCVTTIDFD